MAEQKPDYEELAAQLAQAEAALQTTEEKYRAILDNLDEIVYQVSVTPEQPAGGAVQFVSSRVKNIIGCEPGEFLADPGLWFRLLHPDDIPATQASAQKILESKTGGTREYRLRHKETGEYRWLEDKVLPQFDKNGHIIATFGVARDITERKQAEQALQESEARYRILFENIPLGIGLTTPNGQMVTHNKTLRQLTGHTEAELNHLDIRTVYRDPAQRAALLTRLQTEGRVENFEISLFRKDDSVFEASLTMIPFLLNGADTMLTVLQDITTRKETEKALRESEDRYRDLVEHSHDLICTHDLQGNILTINQRAAKMLGLSPQELAGRNIRDFLATEFSPDFDIYLATVLQNGAARGSMQIITPAGEKRIWEYSSTLRTAGLVEPQVRGMAHDITAQIRAGQEVKRLKEFNENIVQNMAEGIVIENTEGFITFANPAAAAMLGYAPQELPGRHWTDVIAPNSHAAVTKANQRRSEGQVDRYEIELRRKDGSLLPVQVSGSPRFEDGRFAGALAIFTDIAKRVQAERKVRRRNRELALLNKIIAAATAEMDAGAILEIACRELARAFDVPQVTAALIGKEGNTATVAAEYRPSNRPSLLNQVIPVPEELRLNKQLSAASFLGLPLLVDGVMIGSLNLETFEPRTFSAEEIALAASVADQISVALARARLSQTHRRLITAIEQSTECITITDTAGIILYANPAYEYVTGYGAAEMAGQTHAFLQSTFENAAALTSHRDVLTAGQIWSGRLSCRKKDGGSFILETTITPVRDGKGTITNFVEVSRDVTQALQLEEQYRQSQKMDAIGQLTGGIAHDFNNLLTAINGYTELLRRELPPQTEAHMLAGQVLQAGQRAADLVSQLLAFSRKQIIEPEIIRLNAVVNEMDKLLRRIINEDIHMATILTPNLWAIKADRTQIQQVIINLAVNARDAMPNGGRMTIETANIALDANYVSHHLGTEPGEYVLLAVSDTGHGMDKETQKHIFEPFFTTKEVGKGTGLGLATVFGVVKQNGGEIQVYSEVGQGTTFKIYLPRAASPTLVTAPGEQPARVLPGTETILLVEDDAGVRDLVAASLEGQGYTLLKAANGREALSVAENHPGKIDLLLTDVVMPEMGGKALAQHLTAIRPELMVLFMSGYTDNAIAHQGVLDAGISFIQKPFSPAALAQKMRQLLDGPLPPPAA